MAKRTKKRMPVGCLFWLVFILLMAVLFFLNKDTISFVLEKTQAKNILFSSKPQNTATEQLPDIQLKEAQKTAPDAGTEVQHESADSSVAPVQVKTAAADQSKDSSRLPAESAVSGQSQSAADTGTKVPEQPAADSQSPQAVPKTDPAPQKNGDKQGSGAVIPTALAPLRKTIIYWVRIDADGKLIRETAVRMLPKSDVPMSDALEALFNMPVSEELKQGLRTLIPPETKLRAAWVKDGVAYINVSEEFQFNQYGIEGALAQLSQVVFTATEFSTVKSVQILIEGKKKEYLGAEGVWIGTPLSRSSF